MHCCPFLYNGQVRFKIASCHCALSENRAAVAEVVPIDVLSLSLSLSLSLIKLRMLRNICWWRESIMAEKALDYFYSCKGSSYGFV
jgi:hypothetical protein